jgi:predicted signal transduction protein with EAL and GGDEF domain
MRSFATPFDLAGKQVRLTASIGVALYPQDGNEPEQLIGNADTAMYSAKNEGRNSFQFFTAELTRLAQETAVLDTALKSAQQQDEFTLVYQPQFSIATRALVSVEALLRWRRPGLGEVPPGRFIEIAEQNGLIAEIGSWVLLRACEQAAAWRRLGLVLERIAVNVSGQQVRTEAFADQVLDVLQRTGLPPTALEIEVTEHVMMRQVEHSVEQLVRLQNRGVSIAIDDFGTGYSSLSYLKVLPIDILKIDQSFVRDIEVDPDDRAIVESVIVLGKTLRKTIIAEGVETEAQLAFLRERGCDKAQGYLLGKPMAAADIETLLRQQGAAKTDSPGKAV